MALGSTFTPYRHTLSGRFVRRAGPLRNHTIRQRELFAFDAAKSRADGVCYALPSYLSPEAVSGRQLNSQTDVYSVGLLLYEMPAGRPAFQGEDFKKVARKHALERPLNPRIVNRAAKLSSELDRR